MKKLYFLLIFSLMFFVKMNAQPGVWTCLKNNSSESFGVKGQPNPTNNPPSLARSAYWKDTQGNFWIFGGYANLFPPPFNFWSDVWKYDPITNIWTWMNGPGILNPPIADGNIGIPDSSIYPTFGGSFSSTGAFWNDLNGNLWLFNGKMWKYDIVTNRWTRISDYQPISHGIKGVTSSSNFPGARNSPSTWIDNGLLWMFGGSDMTDNMLNDLWNYDLSNGWWTWVSGTSLLNDTGNYGAIGIPDSSNLPSARRYAAHWKDSNDNFWIFGGLNQPIISNQCQNDLNDMWMYSPTTNLWTWMSGTAIINSGGSYGEICNSSANFIPTGRFAMSGSIVDSLGNFYLFGGWTYGTCYGFDYYNDLWSFNKDSLVWKRLYGNNIVDQASIINNIGLPSLNNHPGGISNHVNWLKENEIYVFVGTTLWKYSINPNGCDNYNNINGTTYFDANNNCNIDSEPKIKNLKVQLFDNNGVLQQQVYSDIDGIYSFTTDTGFFSYSIDTTQLPLSVACPSNGVHTSNITDIDSTDYNKNFGLKCKTGFDIGVKSINRTSGLFFPGMNATITVHAGDIARNYMIQCSAHIPGDVIIEIIGPATYIAPSSGALTPSVSGKILTYNLSNISLINFISSFKFIIQTDTTAQIGDQICFSVNVNPIAGDYDTLNNYLLQCFNVNNSIDPNSKEVSPIGYIKADQEWLTYTINFQNTGTASAQHIYILDTLDNNLDVSTFTLLSYSHEPLYTSINNNVVKFDFPYIYLPDSTNDEPNSHGFVQYKIKLNSGLPIGTIISNTAYNFFDFNPPVATNTVVNQIYFINPTITPNNLILCPNESDTLWTQVYDSYQWYKDGNLIPGATQQFLVVDYFNDAGSQFVVEVDSAGVIAQSAPVLVDGWAFLPPFVIQEGDFTIGPLGEMIICPGDTAYLILGLPYDTNIQWTDNGAAIPGANDDTLIVTQAGLYNVSGSPSQCPNYVQSLFDNIQVVMAPPLTPTITPGNLILCPNESDTLFTQAFGTYQWYKDGNLIPGATNQYLIVDAFNDAGSQFSVEVTQGNCTGTSSQVLVDGWAFLPPFVISEGDFTIGPNGEMLMCPGDTAYLILGLPYNTNIQWTNSLNIIPGATDDTLVVTQSGMYHVSGAPSVCPNFIQNLGVTIEVIVQGPPTPVITLTGNTLQTQSGFSYQWYYNGSPVGTNSNTLSSQGAGTYTVTITDAQGCTAESLPFVITAIIENSVSGVVNVNYNSQTSTLQITRSNTTTETKIFVSDVLGRVIADDKMSRGISEVEIKLNNIKPGIYFVNLNEGGSVKFLGE